MLSTTLYRMIHSKVGTCVQSDILVAMKRLLKGTGVTLGLISLPITFADLIGHPASIVGSSMEVILIALTC